MATTKKANHVHKYGCINLSASGRKVFKCAIPGCTHYLPEIELALGRETQCHGNCGTNFIVTRDHLSKSKPLCPNCKEARIRRLEALAAVGRGGEDHGEDD